MGHLQTLTGGVKTSRGSPGRRPRPGSWQRDWDGAGDAPL